VALATMSTLKALTAPLAPCPGPAVVRCNPI